MVNNFENRFDCTGLYFVRRYYILQQYLSSKRPYKILNVPESHFFAIKTKNFFTFLSRALRTSTSKQVILYTFSVDNLGWKSFSSGRSLYVKIICLQLNVVFQPKLTLEMLIKDLSTQARYIVSC